MQPRSRLAAAALLAVLVPALAGCTATAAAGSAIAMKGPADAAAKAWDPAAELAGVMGLEGAAAAWASGMGAFAWDRDTRWERAERDPSVGDGKAELWLYFYLAGSKAYVVVVDKDNNVVRKAEMPKPAEARPLGPWTLNSDDALRIAKEHNQGLREGLEAQRFGVMAGLRHDPDHGRATWTVMGGGGDRTGGGGGMVVLDATSGQVLASHGGFGAFDGMRQP
jgi:hypothetical protein